MQRLIDRRLLLAGLATLPLVSRVTAQTPSATDPNPVVTTPTEDVPYVQTPLHVVRRMLQLAEVGPTDLLWDLGSGDGRIVIAAAKLGARATGFEIDPNLIAESVRAARLARVAARTRFLERDLFTLDFATPSVVTLYLLPEFNLKLRPRLLEQMRPGARVVSHEWDMDDWQADETLTYPSPEKPHGTNKVHRVFLWVIPAQISGRWQLSGARMTSSPMFDISQQYQRVTLTAANVEIAWAWLRGRTLRFGFRHRGARINVFEGEVSRDGREIVGREWFAKRVAT